MKLLITTLCLTLFTIISAQYYSISGKIIDCDTEEVIPFASLKIQELNQTFYSNKEGLFNFEDIPSGSYTLHINSSEYASLKTTLSITENLENLNFTLCEKYGEKSISPIVITATRTEKRLKDVPISTQVITSKSIQKAQVTNLRDFLEQELPGVEFTNNGGYANINMFGFGGKYILFLIDGERMAGETFDNIDYNRINIDDIERIEIVKGASSSLYGSNAIGGVINIITKKPKKPLQITASGLYGSNNEQNYNFLLGSKQKWGTFSLSSSYKSKDPYLLKDRSPLTQIYNNGTIKEQSLSETYIAGYEDYSFAPKLSFIITPKIQLEAIGGYYFKERHTGGLEGYKVRDQFHDYSASLKGNYKITNDKNLSLSVNYDNYNKYNYYKLLNEKEKNYENTQWRAGAIYDQNIAKKHSLVAGAELFSDDLMTFMFKSDGSSSKKDAQNYSLFTQQEWAITSAFTLVTGIRYDYHSQFKGHLTPRLSGMYKINKNIILRGGYSGGFRSPTLKELYTDWFHPYGGGFQIIGNKDMKAEKSNNLNLSTDINLGKLTITAMGQYSHIIDKINTVWVSSDTVQYVNVGKAKIFSAELSLQYSVRKNLLLKGDYTYTHDGLGKQSIIRPHTLNFRVDYTTSFLKKYNPTISLSGKYVSGMNIYGTGDISETDNTTGLDKNLKEEYKVHYDPYSIWKLSLSIPLPYSFSISGGINNLFDYKTKFSSFYSSISPGRTYYVGLRWSFN